MKNKNNYLGFAIIALILFLLWYFKDKFKKVAAGGVVGDWSWLFGGGGGGDGTGDGTDQRLTSEQMNQIASNLIDCYGWTQDNEEKFLTEISKIKYKDDFKGVIALVDFKLGDNILSFLVKNYSALLAIVIDTTAYTTSYNELLEKMK
ncbi:MAG TPA: hypothetical protein PLG30_14165 [Bacteroidia bacterium]|nr:hypothetical protein [Bacteroidia bacterium]